MRILAFLFSLIVTLPLVAELRGNVAFESRFFNEQGDFGQGKEQYSFKVEPEFFIHLHLLDTEPGFLFCLGECVIDKNALVYKPTTLSWGPTFLLQCPKESSIAARLWFQVHQHCLHCPSRLRPFNYWPNLYFFPPLKTIAYGK